MIAAGLLAAFLMAAPADAPKAHATFVRADVDDDLTQKFADALRGALPNAKHMRLAGGDDPDDLSLVVLFKVEPDGKRFDYAVDLMKISDNPTPERLTSLAGTCRETALADCAKAVVVRADKVAKNDKPEN